jgi:hypothetical protein
MPLVVCDVRETVESVKAADAGSICDNPSPPSDCSCFGTTFSPAVSALESDPFDAGVKDCCEAGCESRGFDC